MSELEAVGSWMKGVNTALKHKKDIKARQGRRSKKGKEEEGKEESKKTSSKSEEKEEVKSKKEEPKRGKASQPMLPGMRGAVKREPAKKAPAPPKKDSSKKPQATQPMLPGMSKVGKKSAPAKTKEPKAPKEEIFIPGGVDWASMPPVNLSSPNKGRQFNG